MKKPPKAKAVKVPKNEIVTPRGTPVQAWSLRHWRTGVFNEAWTTKEKARAAKKDYLIPSHLYLVRVIIREVPRGRGK